MEEGVHKMINYLLHMLDINKRQTLCVMPKIAMPPTKENWAKLSKGQFCIINGQHSVVASRRLESKADVLTKIKTVVKKWKCYIVWSAKSKKMNKVS